MLVTIKLQKTLRYYIITRYRRQLGCRKSLAVFCAVALNVYIYRPTEFIFLMKRTSPTIIILIILLAVSACSGDKEILVAYTDPRIAYEGRIDTTRIDAAELYWPGTSIKINFREFHHRRLCR